MSKKTIRILGVHIYDRQKEAGHVQKVLTKYGCSIKTRLGLHEVSSEYCSDTGLLLLELFGDKDSSKKLEDKLLAIPGVEVKKMKFNE